MYWSPSTRTALAEAELEYPEDMSFWMSIYNLQVDRVTMSAKQAAYRTMSLHPSTLSSSALSMGLKEHLCVFFLFTKSHLCRLPDGFSGFENLEASMLQS